ncbi:mobile element protein [Vibrio ponticus]|nr:mobile element protein [Vibrio ponticus]
MDYIELVDWTARQFRENKASMSGSMPPILQRLDINQQTWLKVCKQLERHRSTAVGCAYNIEFAKRTLNKTRLHLYRLDC